MDFLNYLKSRWNLVLGIALAIAVIVTDFLVAPSFSVGMPIEKSNFSSLAKFVVAGLILLLLLPCAIFNERKHMWYWWGLAIAFFATGFILFFYYNSLQQEKTAYNEFSEEYVIIGETLTPLAQKAVDSVRTADGIDILPPSEMLATLGAPEDIWTREEIFSNAATLVRVYLVTLAAFTLFILFSIQAAYCRR